MNIETWSFSRLLDFEKCPYKAWLRYGLKQKPSIPQDTKAADRGTMIHNACENFVKGDGDIIKEMSKFANYFIDLKEKYNKGTVIVEENWGFTQDWTPTGWWDDNVWCRMKLDNFIINAQDEKNAVVVGTATDYKSGKKFGNEVSHSQQGQLYVIGAFLRYPTLEVCHIDFKYLDQGLSSRPKQYTRQKAMKLLPPWNERGLRMTTTTEFKPKPNKINCRFCPYGPQGGDSSCEWGVEA